MNTRHLINEVAKRHNIILDHNDPILVTVTLNELVVEHYIEKMESLLAITQNNLSSAMGEQLSESKETASKIITNASLYVSDNTKKMITEMKDEMMSSFKQEVTLIKELQKKTRRDRQCAIYAAGLAILSAISGIALTLMSL